MANLLEAYHQSISKLDWMTDESIAMLALRLSLMAERVKRRRVLSAEAASSEAVSMTAQVRL